MAGAGFKSFSTGEVLLAADVNTYLMQQSVMVFDDASARTTALGANVAEGMMSYLKDTNKTYRYDGSAWLDDAGTTSPLTTKGDVWGYSTTDARIPVGADGTVLTADSAETLGVKWAAAGGGGKVLQVVYGTYSTATLVASTTYTDTGLSLSITPTSATSKILIIVNQKGYSTRTDSTAAYAIRLLRGSTAIYTPTGTYRTYAWEGDHSSATSSGKVTSLVYLDEPATTSSTTYKTQGAMYETTNSGRVTFQDDSSTSSILLMEIGA